MVTSLREIYLSLVVVDFYSWHVILFQSKGTDFTEGLTDSIKPFLYGALKNFLLDYLK
jgi:hypothetical protein